QMKVAVVYESMFGNTRAIAEAVASGMASSGGTPQVSVMPVADATAATLGEVDLLVVGGPTHIRRMTSRKTRQMGLEAAGKPPKPGAQPFELTAGAAGPGISEWLSGLPAAPKGCRAAAFDTRLSYPLAGGAAGPIARRLRRCGYRVDPAPQGFIVKAAQGPLGTGEQERARAWGASLVR
ncbi:MAG TPA: flavodoxin family protein, partial [Acidimicrobiales bacterium]|nr:flavodoxin family protein [Acidimicrobiales bacterium]